MPEKQRLSAVLDERIVPKGNDGLVAMADVRALSAFDPDVLAAVAADAARRSMPLERGLAMARQFVEARQQIARHQAGEVETPEAPEAPTPEGGESAPK